MKKFIALLSFASVILPVAVSADVVNSDDLHRLASDAVSQNNSCQLTDFALNTQGSMSAAPAWKTLKTTTGISLRYPWSASWQLVGKSVTQFDARTQMGVPYYEIGRFRNNTETCYPEREYEISVLQNTTIKKHYTPAPEAEVGTILEQLTINGRKAAIIDSSGARCSSEELAVEIVKNKKTNVVLISHGCGSVNSEMIRMAGSVK